MNRITEMYSLLQEDLEDNLAALNVIDEGLNEFNYSSEALKEIDKMKCDIRIKIRLINKAYLNIISDYGGTEKDIAINALAGNLILN